MKSNTPFLLAVLQATSVAASFFHWGHHDKYVVQHYKARGPFEDDGGPPEGFVSRCEAQQTFKGKQFTKYELLHVDPPKGMKPWAPGIEAFLRGREHPGHWRYNEDELDKHEHDREYIMMEYPDVPRAVRDRVEHHRDKGSHDHHKWMFAVFDIPETTEDVITTTAVPRPPKPTGSANATAAGSTNGTVDDDVPLDPEGKVMLFAAGAIYETLPLWVAEGSKCPGKPTIVSISS